MISPVLPRRRTRAALMGLSAAIVGGMIAAAPASATFPGDNGKLAFVKIVDGTFNDREIWTVNPDGTDLTQITTDGGQKGAPEWSPDGSKIIFRRSSAMGSGVFTMNPDGSGVSPVPLSSSLVDPVYAPDGVRFAARNAPGEIFYIRNVATGAAISTHPLPEGGSTALDWSPGGTQIAYAWLEREGTELTGRGIGIFDVSTETFTLIRGGDGDLTPYGNPEWSADGQRIFFSQGVSSDIWSMNPDGTGATQLATPGNEDQPAPAPDGTRVAYNTTTNTFSGSLNLMDPDGSDREETVAFGSAGALYDWQPIVEATELEPLTVTKTADASYTRLHRWDITKTPDREVFYNHDKKHVAVDYTVKARKKNGGVRDVAVAGNIIIRNPNDVTVPLGTITDVLPGASCTVSSHPDVITPGTLLVARYTCSFPNQLPGGALTNTVSVNYGDGESAEATAPVDFTTARVEVKNNSVKVIDRLGDGPTRVLADKLTESTTFTYRRYLKAPSKPSCVYHPNTAKVIGLKPNGELERDSNGMKVLATATAKVRVCQKAPRPPSSEDPRPPSGTEDPPKVTITPGSSTNPAKPKPRPAVVTPSSEDPKPGVATKAKLKLTQQARRRTMRLGQRNVLTLRVRNTGTKMARSVVIREKLPKQLRPLRTSKPNKTTIRNRKLIVKLGNLRPGKVKTVRVVVAAVGRPALTRKVKLQASRMKNKRVAQRMRYRARKGLACASAKVSARNARSRVAGVCVKIRSGKPRPEITIEDREDATPR